MKEELEQKLYQKYPKLFAQKDIPHSLLSYGVCIGNGWFNIMDTLCSCIQQRVEIKQRYESGYLQPEFCQIKEKFGSLRIYADNCDETVNGMIQFAEHLSSRTCEDCGNLGEIGGKYWQRCLCKACDKERNKG